MIEFAVLGPLQVRRDGAPVAIRTAKGRRLLALLLTRPGALMTVEKITDTLWPAESPALARRSISVYVSRLRDVLGDQCCVESRPGGYAISILDGELDSTEFERNSALAAGAADGGDLVAAADALRAALALWRGTAFDGFRGIATFDEVAERLDGRRLAAFERSADIELDLGRHADLVPDLVDMVAADPFRERLRAQLMVALYRSGRPADALEVYRQTFRLFADELGVQPGPPLAELHQRMLAGDAALSFTSPAAVAVPRGLPTVVPRGLPTVVPRGLPTAAFGFAGRENPVAALDATLDGNDSPARIAVVSGTAGVGKTTLAVHWAHRVAPRFPDGQLYADLRGFDPGRPSVAPEEVLRTFLTLLGEPADQHDADLDVLTGLFRSRLAGRRMLIVLDNARNTAQVRPMLGADPQCTTVITTRALLLDLIATEGAAHVPLEVFSDVEATEMLALRLGDDRIDRESGAAAEIVTLCAGLPLALAIAAARAAARPSVALEATAAGLRDQRRRLDELELSDTSGVRVAFSLSYDKLSDGSARLFRRLGVHPGPDIGVAAAASLAGITADRANRLLDELAHAHLVDPHRPGRFRLHDLLRTYAAELATPSEAADATSRALDHYLYAARVAKAVVQPQTPAFVPDVDGTELAAEPVNDQEQARTWLRTELDVLIAIARVALARQADVHVWQLAWCFSDILLREGRLTDMVDTQREAIIAARRLNDRYALATSCRVLGSALFHIGRIEEAAEHLRDAATHSRDIGDTRSEAVAWQMLGHVRSNQGRHHDALDYASIALELNSRDATSFRLATIHNDMGWYHASLGNHAESLVHCRQALEIFAECGDRSAEAAGWDTLGYAAGLAGDRGAAIQAYQRAVQMRLRLDERHPAAESLERLGDLHARAGDRSAAAAAWREALAIFDALRHADAAHVREKLG